MISPSRSRSRAAVKPGQPGCGSTSVMTVTPVHRCPRRSGSRIGRTEKYSSRLFDPSVRLAADIRDNEGRVFARQGEVMNPLQYVPFNQTLYFINGDDPAQVAWMKRQTPPTLESKIILVQGSIPEMQKALDSRIYFDQNGVLCQRLGIDQVPARVSAVPGDRFLKVEFIPAEEGRK